MFYTISPPYEDYEHAMPFNCANPSVVMSKKSSCFPLGPFTTHYDGLRSLGLTQFSSITEYVITNLKLYSSGASSILRIDIAILQFGDLKQNKKRRK